MRIWKAFFVGLLVASIVLVACGGDDDDDDDGEDLSPEQAQAALCSSLDALQTELDNLRNLGDDTTVSDLEGAGEPIQQAFEDVSEAADDVQDAEIQDLEDAYNALNDTLAEIDENTPVNEAMSAVRADIDGIVAAWREIYDFAECEA